MAALTPVSIERAEDLMVVGANGGGWVAPAGTANPNTSAPPSPWKALGAISDGGLTYGFSESKQDFTPWGLTSPTRTVVTSSVRTFALELWETGRDSVRSIMYRVDASTLTPDTDNNVSFAETASPSPDRRAFVFDVYDGDSVERFYLPQAEVSDRSDVTFKNDTMSGYSITITTYPDASNNTVYHLYVAQSDASGS